MEIDTLSCICYCLLWIYQNWRCYAAKQDRFWTLISLYKPSLTRVKYKLFKRIVYIALSSSYQASSNLTLNPDATAFYLFGAFPFKANKNFAWFYFCHPSGKLSHEGRIIRIWKVQSEMMPSKHYVFWYGPVIISYNRTTLYFLFFVKGWL